MARPVLQHLSRLLRWTLWLGLVAALALQLRVLSQGGLRLPDALVQRLSARLAAHGLALRADAVWLDPRGRVLVLEPSLALAGAPRKDAFATADAVALRLDRRALLDLRADILSVEITGLALAVPAPQSPTGVTQPVLSGGEFRISRPAASAPWSLDQSSARVLGVPTAFDGALADLPAARPASSPGLPSTPDREQARAVLRRAGEICARLAELPLRSIDLLRITLEADRLAVAAELPALRVPAHPALPPGVAGGELDGVRLALDFPFAAPDEREIRVAARRLSAPLGLIARDLALRVRSAADGTYLADLAAAGVEKPGLASPPVPLVLAASLRPAGVAAPLDAALSLRMADAPWSAAFSGDPAARSGRVVAHGNLTPDLLEIIRPFLPEKARPVLTLTDPVALAAEAELAPGGALRLAVVRAEAGRAVAHHVPFDRAAAALRYEPGARSLRADDLLLVQADSIALGSYEMDTETLAYRFLLAGRLHPPAIEGWFGAWWDRFWADFGFDSAPPAADVDIRGVWRHPERTTVFVGAASGPMRLRALPLDSLATRIQVAVGFFDILGFRATRGPRVAAGSFSRLLGDDHDKWARMGFDVRSDFPVSDLPLLFPGEGDALVAPFRLEAPPSVHLVGEAFGPASATPGRQRYDLALSAAAPLRYADFPLDHLALRLERRDDEMRLEDVRAGFAGGLATGRAVLSGPDSARWLAFDLKLAGASPDLASARWREFQAARRPAAPAAASAAGPSPARDAEKPLGGVLDLALAATGPMADPLAFSGVGSARIADADLGRIRLLGRFSELLSGLGIGLTTLRMEDAESRLALERDRLRFDELRITGPSALVEARGDYLLSTATLDFKARVRPFEQSAGIIGSTASFVLSPLSSALEVDLSGTLEKPEWTFSHGPMKLFRRITGSLSGKPDPKPETPATAPAP